MIKLIASIALLTVLCTSVNAQSKGGDTVKVTKYSLSLTLQELDQLFGIIRTSGKYTGADIENYIQLLGTKVYILPPTADSTKNKSTK